MNLTETLATWITDWKNKELEDMVKKEANRHMVDTLACILCGMEEDTPRKVFSYLREKEGRAGIPLFGEEKLMVSSEDAAFYYGICAHTCDFDDLSKNFGGHPGAVILPVILSLAAERKLTGEQMQKGYIVGVETAAVIGKALSGAGLNAAWNPTSVLGIFGGVAAGAILLNMEKKIVQNALGIAVGEASGLKVNYGSAAKDLTVGHTAAKAIFALKMAELGLSAAEDPLGDQEGLFITLAPKFDVKFFEQILQNWRSDFVDPGIILKPYPACRGVHNGIDDVLTLTKKFELVPKSISRIVCKVQNTVWQSNRYSLPKKGTEGKFSLAYCIAMVILNGKVTLEDFTEGAMITDEIISLMKKVEVIEDETFVDAKSGIEVQIITKNGEQYSARSNYAKGDPRNPMSEREFEEKLHQCLSRKLTKEGEGKFLQMYRGLETFQLCEIYELWKN